MIPNFGFVIDGALAGSGHPGRYGSTSGNVADLATTHGITAVVSLSADPLPAVTLKRHGLKGLHEPIEDFGVPDLETMDRIVDFILGEIEAEGAVLVHCGAGMGRTGMVLACCLVARGAEPEAAVRTTRHRRPGSIETADQERFVEEWARHRASS